MELKPHLQDYTEAEFRTFTRKIWAVDVNHEDHNQLVRHFDTIVGHPDGANMIFYPAKISPVLGPEAVVNIIKQWRATNGLPGFKGAENFVPYKSTRTPMGSDPASKLIRSQAKLVKVQKIAADINAARLAAVNLLDLFAQSLNTVKLKSPLDLSKGSPDEHLAKLGSDVAALSLTDHKVVLAVNKLAFLKMTSQFAKDEAKRDLSNNFYDRPTQETILNQISLTNDQYLANLAAITQRHVELYGQAEAFFQEAEEQIVRLYSVTGTGPADTPATLSAPLGTAEIRPFVMTSISGTAAAFEHSLAGLEKGIRSAVAEFTWMRSENEAAIGQFAKVLEFFTRLGDNERYGLCVPLSELMPVEGHDWQHLANTGSEISLPFRMGTGTTFVSTATFKQGLRDVKELAHIYIAPTDGDSVPSKVRVRAAAWDRNHNNYQFSTAGDGPTHVHWTPETTLNSSHTSPADLSGLPNQIGFARAADVPLIEAFPSITDAQFDDYVIVFPANSGLAPLYVMLKDRREYPGVANGVGEHISGKWLQSASPDFDADIPNQIVDQLRRKIFRNFNAFKKAFWTAVATDSGLSSQFTAENIALMKNGYPPHTSSNGKDALGEQIDVYHVDSVAEGGDVYDMDNMSVMTRRQARFMAQQ